MLFVPLVHPRIVLYAVLASLLGPLVVDSDNHNLVDSGRAGDDRPFTSALK